MPSRETAPCAGRNVVDRIQKEGCDTLLISIGQYLLGRLSGMGVRHMSGVPGDFNLWFMEQTIRDGSVNFVGCCNELNAAYAAAGCSGLVGISALATTTYGVGELASLSRVAGANSCAPSLPLLHIRV